MNGESRLEQRLLLQKDVIVGFSYSFSKSLYEKLLIMIQDGSVWEGGNDGPMEEDGDRPYRVTPLAIAVVSHLVGQLNTAIPDLYHDSISYNGLETLVNTARDFLAIFEKG